MIRKSKFSLRALAALLVCVLISSCFVPTFAEEEKTDFSRDTEQMFMILGSGAAAVSAADAIRQRNKTCGVKSVVICDKYSHNQPSCVSL